MGIQINGQTDTITAIDGALTVSGAELSAVTNLNATGIVTATSFRGPLTGNVNSSGVSTITTLRATSIVGVTTAGITTAYIGSVNDGPISGARNRIINGDCRIDQRNAGRVVTSVGAGTTYVVDRWSVYSGLGGIFKAGQSLNSVSPPVGFSSYIGVQNISVSSSNINTLQQTIEGFNFADFDFGKPTAKPITVSFWMYSSLAGLHGGTFMNGDQTRIFPFSWNYTSSNTWQYVTTTIPGDTSGTWIGSTNAGAASLIFCLGGGTALFSGTAGSWISSVGGGTYGVTGQVNLANSANSTFYVTGVQLESGTVSTPFERRSYGQELALCQRYYQQSNPLVAASALYNTNTGYVYQPAWNYSGSNGIVGQVRLPVVMRAAPTIAIYVAQGQTTSAGKLNIYQGSWQTADAGIEGTGAQSFNVNNTNTGTAGNTLIQFHYTASIEI
jgi:hypothetical protein